jgi:glycine hydroxymethyltransferase
MQLQDLIQSEEVRQQETITLIPSENYATKSVRDVLSSKLVNKYSEGYPGKRYYQGNLIIDQIEQRAIDLAKELFSVPHVNIQPYSGSPANAAALMATASPGDTIMGLKLSGGGHLTHGHPNITFSGKFYNSVQFDVDENGLIEYSQVETLAQEIKPKVVIVGTTAYPRILDFAKFGEIADSIGAYLIADISHIAGLIIGGVHPSPINHAHVIMTTTHKTLRGPRGAMLMVTQKGFEKDPKLAKKIDSAVFPGMQGGPHDNTTAAIAIALEEASIPEFKKYAIQIVLNAKVLADELLSLGFKLTTGGTDNHLMVIDLRNKNISGKEAAIALEEAGIVVNYNSVPHDTNPPANPSGIRIGTPAVTTRGMKEPEMKQIAKLIDQVLSGKSDIVNKMVSKEVKKLCQQYPLV